MSNSTRHSAGSKIAGAAVGGQFAASTRSEADGSVFDDELEAEGGVSEATISELIDELDLSHGNNEVEIDGDAVLISVEARNNATIRAPHAEEAVASGASLSEVKFALAKDLKEFSADEEFGEIWSPEFGEHNGFTSSQFLDGLRADEAHFKRAAGTLSEQAKYDQVLEMLSPEQIEIARGEFENETAKHYGKGELDPYDTTRGQGGYEERFKVFLHREAENGVTW